MNSNAIVPTKIRDLAQNTIPLIEWEDALQTFLNTLGSPMTAKAYQRAVKEAMEALDVEYVADVTAPDLAQYRGGLVARMDVDSPDRLSPATVNLKLAGLRQFLRFCPVTGITRLSKDAIAFVLKSPKATVEKPYQVLSEDERPLRVLAAGGDCWTWLSSMVRVSMPSCLWGLVQVCEYRNWSKCVWGTFLGTRWAIGGSWSRWAKGGRIGACRLQRR